MIVYQVQTYKQFDVDGGHVEHISTCFNHQDNALNWAAEHLEVFPEDYTLVLAIRCGSRPTNQVVWDSREAGNQAAEDEWTYQQEIKI